MRLSAFLPLHEILRTGRVMSLAIAGSCLEFFPLHRGSVLIRLMKIKRFELQTDDLRRHNGGAPSTQGG